MPGLIVYLHQAKNPRASPTGVFAWPSSGSSARSTRWTRLDSRLRGNDSVWCGEGFEPLCFSMTAYYKIPTPEISRARVAAALSVMAPIQSSTRRYAV